jgi:hypothetical protein
LEAVFIFCLIWSLGGAIVQTLNIQGRSRFDKFVKDIAGLPLSSGDPLPPNQLPSELLYDYYFDINDLKWCSWKSMVPEYQVSVSEVILLIDCKHLMTYFTDSTWHQTQEDILFFSHLLIIYSAVYWCQQLTQFVLHGSLKL